MTKIEVFKKMSNKGVTKIKVAKKKIKYRFKQSRFFRSHKLFVTLSSVAIASKWDEPEKIKVFIVSTVGRKVLQSRKGERHNCTVWCNTGHCNTGIHKQLFMNIRATVTVGT